MDNTTIADVANVLRDAESVLFITGAGVSADSGLPTYRGVGGLYAGKDTEDGVAIEEALSGPMFAKRPELTWKYLWQIGSACVGAVPNRAHDIIAKIEAEKRDVWVMTQNVDGLHRAAGSKNLVEVHGHMFDLYCIECGCDYTARELVADFEIPPTLPPKCIKCGGIVRPDVVLFDETIPLSVVQAMNNLLSKRFDVVFSIGTSAVFEYIKQPLLQAHRNGSATVEINPTQMHCHRRFVHPNRDRLVAAFLVTTELPSMAGTRQPNYLPPNPLHQLINPHAMGAKGGCIVGRTPLGWEERQACPSEASRQPQQLVPG